MNRRRQGDLGEISAIDWFSRKGATVFIPFGHSPDVDLIASLDHRLLRVQVKTTTQEHRTPAGEWRCAVSVCTRGGNQSWSGLTKRLDPAQFDFLFVLAGNGRRWCIPSFALEERTAIALGGAKYSEFEIGAASAIDSLVFGEASVATLPDPAGGVSKRSTDGDCKSSGSAFRGSNPLSPIPGADPGFRPVRYERAAARVGETRIGPKRQVTVPLGVAQEAALHAGERLRARADGDGRVILERIDAPAQPEVTAREGSGPGAAA